MNEWALYVDALRRGMREMTYPKVRAIFEARATSGELEEIADDDHKAGRKLTSTREVIPRSLL